MGKMSKKVTIVFIVLSVFFFLAYCGTKVNLDYARDKLENLEQEYESVQIELDVAKENYEQIKEQYSNVRSERNEMRSELNFWQDYAVMVTEHGEKYHTYGCQYVEGRTFWIYNVEAAISRGYEPCSVCDPPRR